MLTLVRDKTPVARPTTLGAGVYRAPYRSAEGHPVLVATDASGRRLAEVVVEPDDDEEALTSALEQLVHAKGTPRLRVHCRDEP